MKRKVFILTVFAVISFCGTSQATIIEWSISEGGNGHYYESIEHPEGIAWTDAMLAAQYRGGYLSTITSEAENNWIYSNFIIYNIGREKSSWIGGIQNHASPDYSEPDGGWEWMTGEPWDYENWSSGSPNDQGGQRYLAFHDYGDGFGWNDRKNDPTSVDSYVCQYMVEYIPEPTTLFLLSFGGLLLRGKRVRL